MIYCLWQPSELAKEAGVWFAQGHLVREGGVSWRHRKQGGKVQSLMKYDRNMSLGGCESSVLYLFMLASPLTVWLSFLATRTLRYATIYLPTIVTLRRRIKTHIIRQQVVTLSLSLRFISDLNRILAQCFSTGGCLVKIINPVTQNLVTKEVPTI
jgi:hypothetical protein